MKITGTLENSPWNGVIKIRSSAIGQAIVRQDYIDWPFVKELFGLCTSVAAQNIESMFGQVYTASPTRFILQNE